VQVATAAENDPSRVRLNEERGQNPGGTVDGPEVFRTVFGEVSPGFPVILQREYSIARDKLGNALELLPEIEALVGGHGAKLLAAVPVFSSDMGRLIVAYYFRSPADLGNGMDVVGASQEFQAILVRAAGFASLARSRVVVSI